MINVTVPKKIVNGQALEAELRAAAGPAYDGYSYNKPIAPDVFTLHFADGTAQATIDAALLAYAAHDPSVKTEGQQVEARQLQAAADLALEDFTNVKDAINALSVADPVKQVLRRMNRNTARLALAVRASIGTDPGA